MKRRRARHPSLTWLAVAAAAFAALDASGQKPASRLKLSMTAAKEVTVEQGDARIVKLVPATEIRSGDVILYTIKYYNESADPVRNAALVGPVPAKTTYVPDSASKLKRVRPVFSINGGKTYSAPPIKYRIRKPDGSEEEKVAPPAMYTHVKWRLAEAVLPGAVGTFRYKVRVK
jgi:uncharacterized repeat protein (TIGR01451 family)